MLIGCREILSVEAFRRLLERERALSDRNNHGFSLIVFAVGDLSEHELTGLVRELDQRVRATDEIGWFNEEALGIVLPFTPPGGAAVLAERVRNDYVTAGALDYQVYAYPAMDGQGRWSFPGVHPRRATPNTAAKTTVEAEELSPYLAPRLPWWKRLFDILGASLGLLAASPALLAAGAAIKLISPGPVFFRQKRVGYRGRHFKMLKLRTMHVDAQDEVHEKHLRRLMEEDKALEKLDDDDDERIIPFIGSLLRRSALDELPQLINVLRGEMSLVGPRPCLPYEASRFSRWQRRRFDALPGLTGLWQVNGKNRTTFTQMVRLDIRYLTKRSPGVDLGIALKTVPAIVDQQLDTKKRR